ncbi:MAG: hypothetical protein IT208_00390 [Chthonomonadales bacterium]|nr:hypothetical protein [Chthonomonadales bacterium]
MARAKIDAGICGFHTTVNAQMNGEECVLSIESDCEAIQKLAEHVKRVDPFREISFRGEGPQVLAMAVKHCRHTACPVPAGILKAMEVAAGLALPRDATIRVEADGA